VEARSKRPSTWAVASVAAIFAGAFLFISVLVIADGGFYLAFLANFLSTLAGFLLGVPIAIWLALRQTREQREEASTAADAESKRRRNGVLEAIRKELLENRSTLEKDRRAEDGSRTFAVPFLMDEVWSAMSDGGQLEWITDAEVLRRLARAYVFIRTIIYLEQQAFEVIHFPGTRAVLEIQWTEGQPAKGLPADRIVDYLNHQDEVCIAAINEALAMIDPVLETTNSSN
jgi:uncharacterized membrane protein YccC